MAPTLRTVPARRLAGLTLLLLLVATGSAHADITGAVTTSAGLPVPGVPVRAIDANGGSAGRSAITDGNGAYTIVLSPSTYDPAPYVVHTEGRGACSGDLVASDSPPVADGAAQNLVLDVPLFCASPYGSSTTTPATAYVWPERGQVLAPPGGTAQLRVLAPYSAGAFAVTLADGSVIGTSESTSAIPITAPASYAGPLTLTYTAAGITYSHPLATLIAGSAPAPAQPTGPFDMAAIVDVSGSMAQADPTDRRKDAVNLLVDLAGTGDRMTAVGFDDEFRDVFGRTAITGASSKATLKRFASARIGDFGGTDYQVGFTTAFDALSADPLDPATPKGAIFLTDGAHNGAYDNAHLKFAFNGTGRSWPVCVVQLGRGFSASDTERLKRIARDTGGSFVKTPTNTQLVNLYFQCQGRATGARTLLRSKRSFRVGQTRKYTRKVSRRERKATFFVSFRAGRYQLRLKQPGGRVFKRSSGHAVRLVRGRSFAFFEVQRPKPGRWTLLVKRQRTGGRLDQATTTIRVHRTPRR